MFVVKFNLSHIFITISQDVLNSDEEEKRSWFYVCGVRELTCLWSEVFDQNCCTSRDEFVLRQTVMCLVIYGDLHHSDFLVTVYNNCGIF